MKPKFVIIIVIISLLFIIGGLFAAYFPYSNTHDNANDQKQLVIYSSHAVGFMNPIIAEFEARTGIRVNITTGRTEDMLLQIKTNQDTGCADIMWGGSVPLLRPYVDQFEEYLSVNETFVSEAYKNKEGMLTRFTDVPSVIIVNPYLAGDIEINGYEELLNPELRGKIAFCTSSASSSSSDHLINMLYAMGKGDPEQGWSYVEEFCRNLNGQLYNAAAVYQGVADGEFVAGLTSEEAAAALLSEGKNIKLVYMKEGVLSAPDCICLIKNAPNAENARAFIDFATSYDAQYMIAQHLNRRSVRGDVQHSQYMPGMDEINIIYSDSELVCSKYSEWLQHFMKIYSENIDNYN